MLNFPLHCYNIRAQEKCRASRFLTVGKLASFHGLETRGKCRIFTHVSMYFGVWIPTVFHSVGDLYKHVSDMLNINLALRGAGDWACDILAHDISCCIHSQESLLLALPLVLLATGILNNLP